MQAIADRQQPQTGAPLDRAPDAPRQQQREKALREQQASRPDVHLQAPAAVAEDRIPAGETPCFPVREIRLEGDDAASFAWALKAADPKGDRASGQCLGTHGTNVVMKRVQNAIIARGYVTTRVLARPQDLRSGVLTLTVVPGRIRAIRTVHAARLLTRATCPPKLSDLAGNLLLIEHLFQTCVRSVAANLWTSTGSPRYKSYRRSIEHPFDRRECRGRLQAERGAVQA